VAGIDQDQAAALVARAQERGVVLRLIGGIAVAIHSPAAAHRSLKRDYADVDYIARGASAHDLDDLLAELDYQPDARFNGLHGRRRRLYFDQSGQRQVDIFVDSFEMCHELPIGERLSVDSPTVPLAELFLSKAQVVELNEKDMLDLLALLADHPVGEGDEETINIDRITQLTGKDWGLWRTLIGTLEKIDASPATTALEEPTRLLVGGRVSEIREAISASSKSVKWKARARVGDRVRWYELPEDPRRSVG
jgi:hypothetical protein